MQDYVDTITKVLDEQDEPVVLVAHSRAELQATQAAEARPRKIHTLVYLAAILLPNGISLLDWKDPNSILWPNVDFNEGEGWDMIRPEIYRESIYHDCSDEDVALSYTLLTPGAQGAEQPNQYGHSHNTRKLRQRTAGVHRAQPGPSYLFAVSAANVHGDALCISPQHQRQSLSVFLSAR